MKQTITIFITFFLIGMVNITTSFADNSRQERMFQLQALVTTLGSGAALGVQISDMFYVGGDFTSLTYDEKNSDESERLKLDFSTQIALVRIYPLSSSGLFFQGGVVSRKWTAEGWSYDSNNDGTIDSNEWVKVKLTFPSTATMIGLGGNWIADWGLSFALGLNYITGGAPDVEIETGFAASQSDIDREEARIKEDAKQFETIAQVYLGLGYAF